MSSLAYHRRFAEVITARLAYDAAITELRPGSRTNYDPRFHRLRDSAALSKVKVFVLRMLEQHGSSRYGNNAVEQEAAAAAAAAAEAAAAAVAAAGVVRDDVVA